MPGFSVVTVATQREDPSGQGSLQILEDSCRSCGLDLAVLGLGKPWTGFAMRLLLYADHIASAPEDEVYLFVDAFDVVLLPTAREIAERFRAFEAPIVFGAETGCWPFPDLAPLYPEAPVVKPRLRSATAVRPAPPLRTPFRYLNAGSFIGYAGAVRRVIHELTPGGTEDDQGLLTRYFLAHQDSLKLDYGAELFQTLQGVEPSDMVFDARDPLTLRNRWLGSDPCLLHGNGAGRTTLFSMLSCLRARGWQC